MSSASGLAAAKRRRIKESSTPNTKKNVTYKETVGAQPVPTLNSKQSFNYLWEKILREDGLWRMG